MLLVGLLNGGVEMIEVLRDSGASASPPEIQKSRIETRGRHNYTPRALPILVSGGQY